MTILDILDKTTKPVDASTLVKKMHVNKTTVYRQIQKFISNGKILEVELGDGKKRYEKSDLKHHHHLICKNCGKFEDVEIDEKMLLKEVSKKSKFKVLSHTLEFFGMCSNCIKK